MQSAIQKEKVDLLFRQLDTNADGFIDFGDVSALAHRILDGVGQSGDSGKGRELLRTFEKVWEQLARDMDADGDARVSPEEFAQGMSVSLLTSEGAYDRYFHPAVAAAYKVVDTDGDGTVSPAEFRALQRAFGTPVEQIDGIFEQFDSDGNGRLHAAEMTQHARDFYMSADPASPGNGLFGPLPTGGQPGQR